MGWWAWLVCVGVGYVCAQGAVGWAGALWARQWVEEMLVTPTGGVLWASKRVCVVDVGVWGDAPGGDGVGDADGVIGDGAGAGGGLRLRWSLPEMFIVISTLCLCLSCCLLLV